jgi:hypothetical protein
VVSFNIPPHRYIFKELLRIAYSCLNCFIYDLHVVHMGRFDLSPFVGSLLSADDATEHTISLSVVNNNDQGLWYLDASVIITHDEYSETNGGDSIDYPIGGSLTTIEDSTPQITTQTSVSEDTINFNTWGSHTYSLVGVWQMKSGKTITRSVSGHLTAANKNYLIGT